MMWMTIGLAGFFFFAEPMQQAGFNWRSAVYNASVWMTGGD